MEDNALQLAVMPAVHLAMPISWPKPHAGSCKPAAAHGRRTSQGLLALLILSDQWVQLAGVVHHVHLQRSSKSLVRHTLHEEQCKV